jgi:hypothetical protein
MVPPPLVPCVALPEEVVALALSLLAEPVLPALPPVLPPVPPPSLPLEPPLQPRRAARRIVEAIGRVRRRIPP